MIVMRRKQLSAAEQQYCRKTMSSDALAALVLDALDSGKTLSVARFSDGEIAVMSYAFYGHTAGCLTDAHWLKKYGMMNADLKKVAGDLMYAAQHSTYTAPSISGLYLPTYNAYTFMADREQYVDTFYAYFWKAAERWQEILPTAKSIHIINRNWKTLATGLKGKYGLVHTRITGFPLNSWEEVPTARQSAEQNRAELVLVSGGPAGKRLPADIAKSYNCVALDVGCGLEVCV